MIVALGAARGTDHSVLSRRLCRWHGHNSVDVFFRRCNHLAISESYSTSVIHREQDWLELNQADRV